MAERSQWARLCILGVAGSIGAFAAALAASNGSEAASTRVKFACARDYYAHCRAFDPKSSEVRACMRAAGEKLSTRCVNALVAEGEVSPKEVAQRNEAAGRR